jgi:predicted O-linked N-acetylglucosamine transferase (SPINDLY family)
MSQHLDINQALTTATKHHRNGRLKEAERIYIRILKTNPNQPDALHLLGILAIQTGEPDVAVELIGRAIGIKPNAAAFHDNLADAFAALGRPAEALAARQKAVSLDKRLFRARLLLGLQFGELSRFDEAIATFKSALEIKPNDAEAYNHMGFACLSCDRLDEALAALREAARLQPQSPQIEVNLGHAWAACAKHAEAIACFDRAIAAAPPNPRWLSARIMAMHYDPTYDSAALLKACRQWDEAIAAPLPPSLPPHQNDRTPHRKLRIGYVSPDLRRHVVGQSILPVFSHHDRDQFEIFCYPSMLGEDEISGRIRQCAHGWRNIYRMNDQQAADAIRADGIDILVDLALHTKNNRLAVFARKPAPVQVAYLGCCSTTGLSAMDYRLSDPFIDPPDVDSSIYSERTIRLARTHLCYEPLKPAPEVSPLPAISSGQVTFGCLNFFTKCNAMILDLWARILRELPASRLILHAPLGQYLDDARRRFELAGAAPGQLEFLPREGSDWPKYIGTYGTIDIGLDPYPYNGGVTTLDALWMGVPVVTLSGNTAVSRMGRSILSNIGLQELVADGPEQYVRIALELAKDTDRLVKLRAETRRRMLDSPLKDPIQFTRDIEAAFRGAWTDYCQRS